MSRNLTNDRVLSPYLDDASVDHNSRISNNLLEEEYIRNPFANNSNSSLLFHGTDNSDELQPRREIKEHQYPLYGDLANATTLNLLNSSDDSLYGVTAPRGYDRFPGKIGSRVVSSSSLNSHMLAGYAAKDHQLTSSSNVSNNGNVNDGTATPLYDEKYDFLPFGGYPASSFPLNIEEKEPDDYLHNPDPIADAEYDKNRFWYDLKTLDKRSGWGLVGIVVLFIGMLCVFVVLPVLTYSNVDVHHTKESYEILTQYQYPTLSAIRTSLIDPDTPSEYLTKKTRTGESWELVFLDEFNVVGRTFYEGDDQFFTAPDIWYGVTKDLEWYDPDAATTSNGTLELRMDAFKNHNLFYRLGMLQSWNKFCFTQGLIQILAQLPNYGNVSGLWPGLWTLGNLGRPGYMASTDGVWPYAYSTCDSGILPNQSSPDGISYLPGQRLNSCTCSGADHPNRGVGRGAPEIDVLEAEVDTTLKVGVASQSLQIAPFDIWYMPDYEFVEIYNSSVTTMNTYAGGPFQQAVSAVTTLNTTWYEFGPGQRNFQRYGFEYLNDDDKGYITWYVGDDPTYTLYLTALHPNGNIGWRHISKEPMSIIMNMGISNNWAYIDWASIFFPVTFRVDYVRVYQPSGSINVGCDPDGYPTTDYINNHLAAYLNPNYTSWEEAGFSVPKNSLLHQC